MVVQAKAGVGQGVSGRLDHFLEKLIGGSGGGSIKPAVELLRRLVREGEAVENELRQLEKHEAQGKMKVLYRSVSQDSLRGAGRRCMPPSVRAKTKRSQHRSCSRR